MTIALPVPSPAAKASIQAWYSSPVGAPPAEYWAQSRPGTLYATSTGTVPFAAARARVLRTFCLTSFGVPPVNQTACGVSIIILISAASAVSPLAVRSAIWLIAP